ncbi:hypothetical protein MNEG_0935, partial [Monoraphidium neglectum]
GVTLVLATSWWLIDAHKWFRGPRFGYGGNAADDEEGDPKGALAEAPKDKDADLPAAQ